MSSSNPHPSERLGTRLAAWCFVAVLAAPGVGSWILEGSDRSVLDNRLLATWPAWPESAEDTARFTSQADEYFSDHFGFRDAAIAAYNRSLSLLGVSSSSAVVVGRQDWFFLGEPIEDLAGLDPLTEDELRSFLDNMNERAAWLTERGVDLLVVIAPNKHSIYSEYLPYYVIDRPGTHPLDQLIAELRRSAQFEWLDLREPLRAEKQHRQLYHRTDSHWNADAAFLAYRNAMAALGREGAPGSLRKTDLEAKRRTSMGHDLVTRLGLEAAYPEVRMGYNFVGGSRVLRSEMLSEEGAFGEWHSWAEVPNDRRVLMLGDSFGIGVFRFVEQSFDQATLIDSRTRGFDRTLIEELQPHYVIYQFVERSIRLHSVLPAFTDSEGE